MRKYLFLIVTIILAISAHSQDLSKSYPEFYYKGYTKSLSILANPDNLDFVQNIQNFHNRNEVEIQFIKGLNLHIHNRNLFYTGNFQLAQGAIGDWLENGATDRYDLSLLPINRGATVLLSSLDRLYLEWIWGNWELRVGRQRVNWGIHSLWNPQDIFNSFSFLDFDYEERPGSDVLSLKYYFDWATHLEAVYRPSGNTELDHEYGLLLRTLWAGTDIQGSLGSIQNYYSTGLGFARNLGQQSVKLETNYFIPKEDGEEAELSVAVSYEASTKKGWIFLAAFLHDATPEDVGIGDALSFIQRPSAIQLYPYENNFLFSVFKPIKGRLILNLSSVLSLEEHWPLVIVPTISYELSDDWNIDLVGQILAIDGEDYYRSPIQVLNVRIRYSY